MLISNIINDGFGLLSRQLRFYCWHFKRDLDQRQRQELINLLYEQHFERLADKIKNLNQSTIADCKQQIGKLLFEHCLARNRRHQLIQLIESELVDINVRLDNYGRTLLHRSAYNLDVELVRILIDHGVNIRLRDYAGNTALHTAIQSYRNGALIYGNGPDVVENLTSIIKFLLTADRNLQNERSKRKRIKYTQEYHQVGDNKFERSNELDKISNQPHYFKTAYKDNNINQPIESSKESLSSSGDSSHIGSQSESQAVINNTTIKETNSIKVNSQDDPTNNINPLLLEDASSPLVDTKNAFGRTALHYCVLVVGENHLAHFVRLLIAFGADTDIIDTRMKTPLYCLVKRPGISAIRQKCLAISLLLKTGCDDLGLAIKSDSFFTDKLITNLENNISSILQSKSDSSSEPIFESTTFKRVPNLKHLARLKLIKLQGCKSKVKRQSKLTLPPTSPALLNSYVNRRILDQSELF